MKITLPQIQLYSECPRKTYYSLSKKPVLYQSSLKELIKQAYINYSKDRVHVNWETIKNRVNKLYFTNVDVSDTKKFDTTYKQSVHLLNSLHTWYYKHYINNSNTALVNIDLSISISNSYIDHRLDLILIDSTNHIIPVIFNDSNKSIVYNSIEYQTILWLIYKETKQFPLLTTFIQLNELSISYQTVKNTLLEKTEGYLTHIVKGIEKSAFYPSINSQCSQCEFVNICSY